MRGFSEALRRELADSQIKVLYIAPRATRTAMNSADVVAMNDELKVEMDDPQEVARQIVHAITAEREEFYLGWPEKLFVRLNGVLPRLVDQALRAIAGDQALCPCRTATRTATHLSRRTPMKPLLGLCALMLALASLPSFALSPAGESSLRQIQTRWAEITTRRPRLSAKPPSPGSLRRPKAL